MDKKQLPIDIPIRNVLLNPGPATTTDTVKYSQVVPDICPRETEFGDMMAWVQRHLVQFVCDDEHKYGCVLLGGSGTAAVESVISSVVPNDGVLLVINNGAYGKRILQIAETYALTTVEFASSNHKSIDYTQLEQVIIDKKITHVAVVHHETTSGLLNDIRRIGALCKSHDIVYIVDAMSSFGALEIDMQKDVIHYMITSSNKNLQGMAGIGIICCDISALEHTANYPMRGLYLNLYKQYEHFNNTKQFRFTPPVQTCYALKQAIIELQEETIAKRRERYMTSYRTLRKGMETLGFKVLVPDELSSGMITTFFEPKSSIYSFEHMHDYLYAKGFTIYPGKVSEGNTFRIATIGAIDAKDISQFLSLMKVYLEENSIIP